MILACVEQIANKPRRGEMILACVEQISEKPRRGDMILINNQIPGGYTSIWQGHIHKFISRLYLR